MCLKATFGHLIAVPLFGIGAASRDWLEMDCHFSLAQATFYNRRPIWVRFPQSRAMRAAEDFIGTNLCDIAHQIGVISKNVIFIFNLLERTELQDTPTSITS